MALKKYIQTKAGVIEKQNNLPDWMKTKGSFYLKNTNLDQLRPGALMRVRHVMDPADDVKYGIIKEVEEDRILVQLSDGDLVEIIGLILEFISLAKTIWLTIKALFDKDSKSELKELQKLNRYK